MGYHEELYTPTLTFLTSAVFGHYREGYVTAGGMRERVVWPCDNAGVSFQSGIVGTYTHRWWQFTDARVTLQLFQQLFHLSVIQKTMELA